MDSNTEKYYLFIDESGDHGLSNLDPGFPVFLLCGIVMHANEYEKIRVQANEIKRRFWGNKDVIFHSSDIRKCNKEFQILFDLDIKAAFYKELNNWIAAGDYAIIASAINKEEYIKQFGKLSNDVYELALSFIIERCIFRLDEFPWYNKQLEIIIERRGKKEDKKLDEHFQRLQSRGTSYVKPERLKHIAPKFSFRDKKENINGLQLADLIAYPIARYVMEPERANPAFDVFAHKFYAKNGKRYGLKVYP